MHNPKRSPILPYCSERSFPELAQLPWIRAIVWIVIETRAFVGCCGWTEAQARYVTDFQSIELQTTFYQPPAVGVAKRWKSKAPPKFRFCMKASQLITHALKPYAPPNKLVRNSHTKREL
jgi:hypothetical protein